MARSFSARFYKSRAWQDAREAYIRSVDGLCERCMRRGVYRPGVIVHHIVHLTPENINDPEVTLGFDNLEYVCRDCHAAEHPEIYGREEPRDGQGRYSFDADGNLVPWEGSRGDG